MLLFLSEIFFSFSFFRYQFKGYFGQKNFIPNFLVGSSGIVFFEIIIFHVCLSPCTEALVVFLFTVASPAAIWHTEAQQ